VLPIAGVAEKAQRSWRAPKGDSANLRKLGMNFNFGVLSLTRAGCPSAPYARPQKQRDEAGKIDERDREIYSLNLTCGDAH
jgi:hypothetical protein